MQTHQIKIEFAEDRDRFAMAVIDPDPEWDVDVIHATTKVASTRTKVATCDDTVVGYIIMRFKARRLAIVRLIAEYDDVATELIRSVKVAVYDANQKRLKRQLARLQGLSIEIDFDDVARNDLLRANGFRAAGVFQESAVVWMTWDRK